MTIDIGNTITATHHGQTIIGTVVGIEDARHRRGYVNGTLYYVAVQGREEWALVHERELVDDQTQDAGGANVVDVGGMG